MQRADKISEINLKAFSKEAVAKFYSAEVLQKAEAAAINAIKEEIRDKKILEIGVGGGKTIPYLKQISSDYTGIDYSQEMVNACRRQHPDVHVMCCDARDMSVFDSDRFDFVLCAFNGMDYVTHEDRLLIMAEVYRVLRKGGYFIFSTHNKNCSAFNLYTSALAPYMSHNPLKSATYNPVIIASKIASFLRSIINHHKNARYVIHTNEYSIINDKAHDYSLMTYYIDIIHQKQQLTSLGFKDNVRIFDRDGAEVSGNDRDTWLYYLAEK